MEAAQESITAGYRDAKMPAPAFNRLGVGQAESLIAVSSKGAPLRELLAQTFPDAVQGMTQALIDGAALGWNPVKTAREMRNGTALGLDRALVLARDQQLRAARASTDEQYRRAGVVIGKRRLAAQDLRTCLACLARDGELLRPDEPAYDHVLGRCSFIPVLEGVPELERQTAGEWFKTLDPAGQRRMMGEARFEAWQAGKFQFGDLAATTEHKVWGQGLRVRTIKELEAYQVRPGVWAVASPEQAVQQSDFVKQVQALDDPKRVLQIGETPAEIADRWGAVTRSAVLTGERRKHYLGRHPDVAQHEGWLQTVILEPDEVHRNKKDRQMAIVYRRLDDEHYLRVALWMSPTEGLMNSVHSYRVARLEEVLAGRNAGRRVWEKK